VRLLSQPGKHADAGRLGFQSKELIVKAGLNLGDVDQFPKVDVTIDGADEVDADLNAIKGGGACLLREKVLAEAADVWIMVADSRKGEHLTQIWDLTLIALQTRAYWAGSGNRSAPI
jgi:ribose 5-phosphate isomerase A